MAIRTVKKYSDRGSLRDLVVARAARGDELCDAPPTEEELELKKLYEYAEHTQNDDLKEALGFIVMPNSGDRSAFPVSVYRHREYIASLSEKRAVEIEQTKLQLAGCFGEEFKPKLVRKHFLKQEMSKSAILSDNSSMVKIASTSIWSKLKRSFSRVG
jgi:hypothetical protein